MAAPLGNMNNRKGRRWSEAINRALARYSGESVDKGLDMLADKLVRAAMEGDDREAFSVLMDKIADRIEGKAAQQLPVTEDGREVLTLTARIQLIAPQPIDYIEHKPDVIALPILDDKDTTQDITPSQGTNNT